MKEKTGQILINNIGNFISGEDMSKTLGISRAAIWKDIAALKEDGYEIESVRKKGYKLISLPEIFDKTGVMRYLNTEYIARKIDFFKEVDSTNDYAKKIAKKQKEGTVVLSDCQLKGKGRLGRTWISKKGQGIYMSIILKPDIQMQKVSFITQVAGAAILKALLLNGVEAKIKWPNDIVLNGKKIAGILTEMNAEIDRVNYVVLGTGINILNKKFDEEISKKATSLFLEGYKVDKNKFAADYFNIFEELYKMFLVGDVTEVLNVCRQYSAVIGKEILLINRDVSENVFCEGIDELGNLIVKYPDGNKKAIFTGEISIRSNHGYI